MKKAFIFFLFGIYSTLGQGQWVTSDFLDLLEKSEASIPPFYYSYLNDHFHLQEDVNQPPESAAFQFILAAEHDSLPLEIRLNMRQVENFSLEKHIRKVGAEIGISVDKKPQPLDSVSFHFSGCERGYQISGRQTRKQSKYKGVAHLAFLRNNSLFEITLFYQYPDATSKESFNDVLNGIIHAVRFALPEHQDIHQKSLVKIAYDKTKNAFLVDSLAKQSSAYIAGLLPGDEVYAINGILVSKKDVSRIEKLLQEPANLEVKRGELFHQYKLNQQEVVDSATYIYSGNLNLENLYFDQFIDYHIKSRKSEQFSGALIDTLNRVWVYQYHLTLANVEGEIHVDSLQEQNTYIYHLFAEESNGVVQKKYEEYARYITEFFDGKFLFKIERTENSILVQTISPDILRESISLERTENDVLLKIVRPFNLDGV